MAPKAGGCWLEMIGNAALLLHGQKLTEINPEHEPPGEHFVVGYRTADQWSHGRPNAVHAQEQ